jgi:clan AA aspartic protease
MGIIYADVELINGDDLALSRKHIIGDEEIKKMHVKMLVDTGSVMLAINENIQEILQFPVIEKRKVLLANSAVEEYDVVGPVELRFRNRQTSCRAIVLPGDSTPLLGAIPIEDMDVIIHPTREELIVNPEHLYMAQMIMK